MKPIAVIQHDATHRPGYLLDCLSSWGVEARIVRPSEGGSAIDEVRDFSGVVLLGSHLSATDDDPWIRHELRLIESALRHEVPVLGHSFGGHLLARAMGADVRKASTPNIGWAALHVTPHGKSLFGDSPIVMGFNWHRETFSIPSGATRTLFGRYTLNEGYACGANLAFQCHLELTAGMIGEWCTRGRAELRRADGHCAQREQDILARVPQCVPLLHRAAQAVYGHWLAGVQAHDRLN
jgi:GMP synthase-like glutamine amidotransferase